MRFLVILVEDSSSPGHTRQAYASCWIDEGDRELASRKAAALVRSQGWSVVNVEEDRVIRREDYGEEDFGLNYYDQACIDGEVAVLFVFDEPRSP